MNLSRLYNRLRQLGVPFWCLWFGETISMFGTRIVQFALGVWIFEQTGSVLSFVGAILAGTIPAILVTPFAGSVVDKLDRRYVMIVADSIAAIMTLCLFFFIHNDSLEIYHLYIFTAVASVVGAFQGPAYQAALGKMVRKDHLTRAMGAMGVSSTTIGIIVPALAGALLVAIGLPGLILLDLTTFVIGTMFVWRAFSMAFKGDALHGAGNVGAALRTSFKHFGESVTYFERNPTMLVLLLYSLMQVAMTTMAVTMVIPLVLSSLNTEALGIALSCGATGALLGSLLMTVLDSPSRRMILILVCDIVFALCIIFAGFASTLIEFCILEFFAGIAGSIASSCAYAVWMSRIPERQVGSVLVLIGTVMMIVTSVVVVSSGVLVETVLEPALAVGGALEASVGYWLGVGEGRGMGLMFIICGILGVIVACGGLFSKTLRDIH